MKDPIVEEIRAAREALAARFNFDVHAIGEYIRRRQRQSGRRVVNLSATTAAKQVRRALTTRGSTTASGPRRTRAVAAKKRARQHA
jgi:hypothetical protein